VSAVAVAEFASPAAFREAFEAAEAEALTIVDAFAPIPMPELGRALAPDRGMIRWVAAAAGLAVAVLGWTVQWWSSVHAYPLNAGSRPLNSWPVYVGTVFEVGVLAAAVAGFAAFLVKAGLPRLNHPAFDLPGFERASQDRWFLAVACGEDEGETALAWLRGRGAVRVERAEL
jgi:hypothetical protein